MVEWKIVFDTCIINCLVDGELTKPINELLFLGNKGVKIFVQHSILKEIEATKDSSRMNLLKECVANFEIVDEHLSILPFQLPANLCSEEDSKAYEELSKIIDRNKKDARVILDSMKLVQADIFVTTDKKIIKNKDKIKQLGFVVMMPEECREFISKQLNNGEDIEGEMRC